MKVASCRYTSNLFRMFSHYNLVYPLVVQLSQSNLTLLRHPLFDRLHPPTDQFLDESLLRHPLQQLE